MLLCKCVPVLTLDVLQIAEDQTYVAWLTNFAKAGYFSAVFSFIQKSTDPVSFFCASRSHSCNWIDSTSETSSTYATCWFKASCGLTVGRGLLTISTIAAML